MIAATMIGAAMQMTDSLTAQRIIGLVRACAPLPRVEVNSEGIVKRLLSDKKTVGGVPHFVLPTSIGTVEVVNTVPERAILHAVEEIKKLSEA
jgi:3-dehydroquinate synthetase